MAEDKKLKITLVKSTIGCVPKHRKIVEAMGLRKLHHSVELPDTGGPGTLLYSMLGMMLIALAGTAYMILLRRRRASLKGGGNLR